MPGETDPEYFSEAEFEEMSSSLEQLSRRISIPKKFKDLGLTPLAQQLGLTDEQLNGHWCSRCQGIWFGYTLEVQCPVCGNRNG